MSITVASTPVLNMGAMQKWKSGVVTKLTDQREDACLELEALEESRGFRRFDGCSVAPKTSGS